MPHAYILSLGLLFSLLVVGHPDTNPTALRAISRGLGQPESRGTLYLPLWLPAYLSIYYKYDFSACIMLWERLENRAGRFGMRRQAGIPLPLILVRMDLSAMSSDRVGLQGGPLATSEANVGIVIVCKDLETVAKRFSG